MQQQNARQVSSFGSFNPRFGHFASELSKPADWDQLLVTLRLTDTQALEAVKSDEAVGRELQDFVLRFSRHQFVPEAVMNVVFRRRKERRWIPPSEIRGIARIDSSDVEATSGGER